MTGTRVFDLRNVSKRYGTFEALSDIDLEIMVGERVALVGPSGAGKTTLLNVLNGTLTTTEGEVRVLGENLADVSSRVLRGLQRQIGTVHQQFHLVNNLKVVHNVNAGHLGRWSLFKAGMSLVRPLDVPTAQRVLSKVGIGGKLFERTGWLSGGEQQRVALARVLVQDPKIILADEPLSSLDPEHSRVVMDLLRDLATGDGKTAVLCLHDVNYAFSHCERMIGLRQGRVVFDSPTRDVTTDTIRDLYAIER